MHLRQYILSHSVVYDSFATLWSQNHRSQTSSVHGAILGRLLEWVTITFSGWSFWTRVQSQVSWVSCIGRQILYHGFTWKAPHLRLYISLNFGLIHIPQFSIFLLSMMNSYLVSGLIWGYANNFYFVMIL